MRERRCDRCGRPILSDGAILTIGGTLRQRLERADLCAGCAEQFYRSLEHYHASTREAASDYRPSGKGQR